MAMRFDLLVIAGMIALIGWSWAVEAYKLKRLQAKLDFKQEMYKNGYQEMAENQLEQWYDSTMLYETTNTVFVWRKLEAKHDDTDNGAESGTGGKL